MSSTAVYLFNNTENLNILYCKLLCYKYVVFVVLGKKVRLEQTFFSGAFGVRRHMDILCLCTYGFDFFNLDVEWE